MKSEGKNTIADQNSKLFEYMLDSFTKSVLHIEKEEF